MPNYKDLRKQIEELEKQAEKAWREEVSAVIADIKQKIEDYELTAEDLGLSGGKRRRKSATKSSGKAQYRDPETGATWTGKGRAPNWIVEAEAAGKSRDAFKI